MTIELSDAEEVRLVPIEVSVHTVTTVAAPQTHTRWTAWEPLSVEMGCGWESRVWSIRLSVSAATLA